MSDPNEIIDVTSLMNKTDISNSEYLLLLLEISSNAVRYKLNKYSHSSKNFWDNVISDEYFGKLFRVFKGDTLKKYWNTFRKISSVEKLVEFVKSNEESINNPGLKLLQIINLIEEYFKSGEKSFNDFLISKNISQGGKENFSKNVRELLKESKEKKEEMMLQNKRKREEEIAKIDKMFNGDKKEEIFNVQEEKKETKPPKKEEPLDKETLDQLKNLDEIIEEMKKVIKDPNADIEKALYMSGGNIRDAYLYLKNPAKNDDLVFLETDDYILKNLRDKAYYQQLLEIKGEKAVKERKEFLKIND